MKKMIKVKFLEKIIHILNLKSTTPYLPKSSL